MPATGGIKFFEKSKFLYSGGATAFSMSGSDSQFILNHNRKNQWTSVRSDDTKTETIAINLGARYDIDTLILNGHNFKDVTIYLISESQLFKEDGFSLLQESGFNLSISNVEFAKSSWSRYITNEASLELALDRITYEQGGHMLSENFSDFAAVKASTIVQRILTGSNLASTTTLFEFDETGVSDLLVEVTTTQTVDAQKFLKSLIGTTAIGTLTGYPAVQVNFDRSIKVYEALSGKKIIQKGFEAANISLGFNNYPGQADATIIEALQDSDEDFIIWLCGGLEGTDYFKYETRGFDIDDLYLGNLTGALPYQYTNSIYVNPYNTALNFSEVTG
jgi:hypothetical protein